jgi:hypothetical protein
VPEPAGSEAGRANARRRLEARVQLLTNIRLAPPALGSAVPLAALGTLGASCGRSTATANLALVFVALFLALGAAFRLMLGVLRRKNLAAAKSALASLQEPSGD